MVDYKVNKMNTRIYFTVSTEEKRVKMDALSKRVRQCRLERESEEFALATEVAGRRNVELRERSAPERFDPERAHREHVNYVNSQPKGQQGWYDHAYY